MLGFVFKVSFMTSPLRTAVIGVGYLGKYHADKYALLPQSTLVAVVDTHEEYALSASKKHAVPALSDYRELSGKVDAVSIATPTVSHATIATFFLAQGVHVLLEKPICLTPTEAEGLIQLAKKTQSILQIGHLERFNPALQHAQMHLQTTPTFIEARRLCPFKLRARDVDVVIDLMIHDIDIIQTIAAAPIRHLHASGTTLFSTDADIAHAHIEFENGCIAHLTANRVSPVAERKLDLYPEKNYLSVDFQAATCTHYTCSTQGINEEIYAFENKDTLLTEIEAFLYAIETRTPPVVSGEAGLKALETALHISKLIKGK